MTDITSFSIICLRRLSVSMRDKGLVIGYGYSLIKSFIYTEVESERVRYTQIYAYVHVYVLHLFASLAACRTWGVKSAWCCLPLYHTGAWSHAYSGRGVTLCLYIFYKWKILEQCVFRDFVQHTRYNIYSHRSMWRFRSLGLFVFVWL
jgi:hypothetical protein